MEVKNPAYTHNRLIIIKLSKKCKQMGIEQLNFVGNDGLVQPFREDVAAEYPDVLKKMVRKWEEWANECYIFPKRLN